MFDICRVFVEQDICVDDIVGEIKRRLVFAIDVRVKFVFALLPNGFSAGKKTGEPDYGVVVKADFVVSVEALVATIIEE